MRTYLATYHLHDGQRGHLHILAGSSCTAAIHAIEALGAGLRCLSVRPA